MSTRDTILSCARDLYLREGIRGLSMRAVARCAGISAPAIYRHFEDKDDLLWEVAMRGHEVMACYLSRALRGRDARDRLVELTLAYLDFALENRAFYLVMFGANPFELQYEKLQSKSRAQGEVTFRMLVDRVRECIDAGVLPERDPLDHTYSIWGHVHGLVTLYFRVPSDERRTQDLPPQAANVDAFRAFYRWSIEALLQGLRATS